MKLYWSLSVISSLMLVATSAATMHAEEKRGSSNIVPGKDYDRIVIVLFENQNYGDVAKDPYFSTLANKHNGVTLTNYNAITHPSQPNYIGMISGSTKGTVLDLNSNINRNSVVDLLEAKGVSWKSYQEGYPGNCDPSEVSGTYHRKHNPFISINNIRNNATRCAKIVSGTQLDIDIENNDVPQFVFYTPDINNDGHDTTLEYSSDWAKGWLEPRLGKAAFNTNTLFVLTWDEQKTYVSLKNQVYTILLGSAVQRSSRTDGGPYNHYSVLRSVEDNWGLGTLGQKDDGANPLIIKDLAENGASEKIKNVVLLVLENRSFDRMMGWFKYNKDIDGLTGEEFNYVNPSDPSSEKIYATRNGLLKDPLDPAHGYQDVTYQISGDPTLASDATMKEATMGGFVQNFIKTFDQIKDNATAIHQIMDGFDPSKIPITYELASNYTIMNRYFSSFPGSTMPNRLYVHSGTSHGEANTDGTHYIKGYSQKTIYNSLDDAGIEWKNYYEEVPSLIVFTKLRTKLNRFKNWSTFKSDAASGNLPPVSFLDPAYFGIANCIVEDDNHPPADVAQGERLLKDVYETLRASPQWNETLFIVTYDEHGGYHDHVPTPLNAPNPDGINVTDFNFNRLGVRVPALLISPWVEKGGVIGKPDGPYPDSEYEHSSIPATIKKIFNLPNFLTKRDAWAGTFEGAITESKLRTDCPTKLSPPPAPFTTTIPTKLDTILCDGLKAIIQG